MIASDKIKKSPQLRINQLNLKNFKGLETLKLQFPEPSSFYGDVTVIISKNGGGKTSILQALAIGIFTLMACSDKDNDEDGRMLYHTFHILDELMGQKQQPKEGFIELEYSCNDTAKNIKIKTPYVKNKNKLQGLGLLEYKSRNHEELMISFPAYLFGNTKEGFLLPPLIFLHSFRKLEYRSFSFNEIINNDTRRFRNRIHAIQAKQFSLLDQEEPDFGVFKQKIMRHLVVKSGLVAKVKNDNTQEALEKLDLLLTQYARVTLNSQLDPNDGEFNLMVTKTEGGESFLFDHLSSGQKEIIYTYFTIWETTKDNPSVVLIDEPELHLNAEWQVGFIEMLRTLSPDNQYIVTTHSQHIAQSVPALHCIEIVEDEK